MDHERLAIENGAFGPVPECTLEIRPLTVFIGKQGSGKSLVAQALYFFRSLPYLVDVALSELAGASVTAEAVVRRLLDRLRSPVRAFAGFASPSVTLSWMKDPHHGPFGVRLYSDNRRTIPDKALRAYVEELELHPSKAPPAVFLPTERLLYSMLRTPRAARLLSISGPYVDFADWITRATDIYDSWASGRPDTPQGRWIRQRAFAALAGEAMRHGTQWKWRYPRKKRRGTLDIDMASSGQRATWPLVLLAETLFSLKHKRKRGIPPDFTIFVEEPEIHLHPQAEVAVAEMLAYMVYHGFRVVVTTHSLTTLYALNNLSQAGRLGEQRVRGDLIPAPQIRLQPSQIAAYLFGDGEPKSLVNEQGFIDERPLGDVAETLSGQMNAITAALRRLSAGFKTNDGGNDGGTPP